MITRLTREFIALFSEAPTPQDVNILSAISLCFINISRHIQQHPPTVAPSILHCYLTAGWSSSLFLNDTLQFCHFLIDGLADSGIRALFDSGLFPNLLNCFTLDDTDRIRSIFTLVLRLFCTHEPDLKQFLISAIDFEWVKDQILSTKYASRYRMFIRLAQNISEATRDFDWIFEAKMWQELMSHFPDGRYENKYLSAQLIFMIMAFGTIDQARRIFDTELANYALDCIQASPPRDLKRSLKAIGLGMAKISRYGLANYGFYNHFCDNLIEYLKVYMESADGDVKEVATAILSMNFPEQLYD
jgi:hypothetical protein